LKPIYFGTDWNHRKSGWTLKQHEVQAMDISSTLGLASYVYTPSSNKTETSASLVMLNKANEMQADSAKKMIQSVTETASSSRALPDHIGRTINVTA